MWEDHFYIKSSPCLQAVSGRDIIFTTIMSQNHSNDPLLIERFEKIYFSTKDQLITFVKKNAPKKEMVEDIAQECYIILWNKLPELTDDENVISLLRTISRRIMINALQKSSREYLRANIFCKSQQLITSTEDALHIKEMMQDFQKAVNALPPKRRQVYRLVKEEGLSHQQTAQRLNVSTNTIERHINEAMRTLRMQFAADKLLLALILVRIPAAFGCFLVGGFIFVFA